MPPPSWRPSTADWGRSCCQGPGGREASRFLCFVLCLRVCSRLPHAHVHSRRNFEDDVLLSPKAPLERSRTSGRSLFRQQGAVPQSPKSVRMKRRPSMDEARLSPSVFAVLVKLVRKPHLRYLKYQPAQTNLGTKSVAEGGGRLGDAETAAFRTLPAVLPSSCALRTPRKMILLQTIEAS